MINWLNSLDFVFLLKLRIKLVEKPTFLVTHVGSCGVLGEGEGKGVLKLEIITETNKWILFF